ncbi:hypothetical protein NHG32_06655 [Aerococcaceae bacterium NML191219]|nr:hypothetical protein [Aerococcaceae bacterium NML191219]
MYKYEVILKCIVPMLHFQRKCKDSFNKDEYATLRGSEFKPMLDKFICQVAANKNAQSNLKKFMEKKEYLLPVEGNVRSFRYSVEIEEKFAEQIEVKTKNASVKYLLEKYCKENGKSNEIVLVLYKPTVKVIFKSEYLEIINVIKEKLPSFIAFTQFGFRKGKGFGQFIIEDKQIKKREAILRKISLDLDLIIIEIKGYDNVKGDLKNLIESIDLYNKFIKQKALNKFCDLAGLPQQNIRLIAGAPTSLKEYDQISKEINRFANPFKYYTNEDRTKLFLLIRKDEICSFMDYNSANLYFKAYNEIFDLKVKNIKNLNSSSEESFFKYFLSKILEYNTNKIKRITNNNFKEHDYQ